MAERESGQGERGERRHIELNWECPKGKLVKSRKGARETAVYWVRFSWKVGCTQKWICLTVEGRLFSSLSTGLSTPWQLLPAIERIWIALSPSL